MKSLPPSGSSDLLILFIFLVYLTRGGSKGEKIDRLLYDNYSTISLGYGEPFTKETEERIITALRPSWIQGLSILGGDPMEPENQKALLPFLRRVKAELPGKDIWLYTGYTYEQIKDAEILEWVDVIVDGPFVETQKDAGLAFRGSRNQRIIHLREGEKE